MKPQVNYSDLAGRRALVTGAAGGIGFGIAEALLEQGASVALHYRTGKTHAETLCAKYPGRVVAIQADLREEAECGALVRETLRRLGGLEILVHSAGIWNAGSIDSIEATQLEEMFRVNVFSAFYLVREAVHSLRKGGHGSIIFIGSTAGQRGEAGHSHYAASKGALGSLCLSLAVELAPEIRTNLVSPGWVRTPMAEEALAKIGPIVSATLPNRRMAEIDDVAHAVLYLASDASGDLLGQDIGVSGGALLVVPRGQIMARNSE